MNKEYKILNDEVIVKDEHGKESIKKNSDKIDEILVCESKIELLNKKINSVVKVKKYAKKKLKEIEKNIRYNNLWNLILLVISISIALLLNMSLIEYLSIFLLTYIVRITATVLEFIDLKKTKKRIKGLSKENGTLELELFMAKEELKELNSCKKLKTEDSLIIKKVNDKEALKELEKTSNILYDCGYHEEEYMRYYLNDSLEKKLMKVYSKEEIDMIKTYFEIKSKFKKKVRKR